MKRVIKERGVMGWRIILVDEEGTARRASTIVAVVPHMVDERISDRRAEVVRAAVDAAEADEDDYSEQHICKLTQVLNRHKADCRWCVAQRVAS